MDRTVRYATNAGVSIAYQVVGEGPIDLVYTPGIWSNLEVMWDWPAWRHYLERLAVGSRLVLFDMRGIGLSDRGPEPPILERQSEDIRAVLDAVGSESAAVFGGARGAAATMLFAASHPARVRSLVLWAPVAKTVRSDDWPFGHTEEHQRAFIERFVAEMGTGENLELQGPSYDAALKEWWARFERLVATPGAYRELAEIFSALDIRHVLPSIQTPTLVLHRSGDRIVRVEQGRAIAERIPGARFLELSGDDHIPFLGDAEAVTDAVTEFVTGSRPNPLRDRVLATVMFTDIVSSTDAAARLGDRRWREVLADQRAIVREQLASAGGIELDTAGDGFLVRFDGPARAIACAEEILTAVRDLGIELRVGIHTGECEVLENGLAGIAVHVAARVASAAAAGQTWVSSTVKELVAGSGITFDDRGMHELKGVPDRWRLYAVM